ncbi:MBL fold metallo-hydrolase [Gryllotalpicola ginsengisoli]|uniref:MBL fold metallo-hydrolase n=1 Tax=Gryllotalpicola ginsengisoli TaxID=444608 RepID=UPI0003B3B50C|nr:MBL fold metallo-hydrolase [Gryllotalpicola ginsengisoli]
MTDAEQTTIEFFGGLGVIGSSKIVIEHAGAWVQLDMGLDIPSGQDLMAAPVGLGTRPGRELADLLRIGAAPRIPGLYDPRLLPPDVADDALLSDASTELSTSASPSALFISHAHLDHMGLAGFVRPSVPVYATPQTVRLLEALAASGDPVLGREPEWREIAPGEPLAVGPITVEAVPVDHDVPGAAGFLVTTPDGTIAFTGDLRFHGEHPELSHGFADRVHGVDALITEGTTLSWEPMTDAPTTEDDVLAQFAAGLHDNPALVLVALYPRNVERAQRFIETAAAHRRTLVWPGRVAALFARLGVKGVAGWGESRNEPSVHTNALARAEADGFAVQRVDLGAVHAQPDAFVVMPDPHDLPSLLDLPVGPGTVLLHANGQPLGDFDVWWAPFTAWLAKLGIELRMAGAGGHASSDALHAMVETIAPRVVFPIHTFSPRRLQVPRGTRRIVAEYGVKYVLAEL